MHIDCRTKVVDIDVTLKPRWGGCRSSGDRDSDIVDGDEGTIVNDRATHCGGKGTHDIEAMRNDSVSNRVFALLRGVEGTNRGVHTATGCCDNLIEYRLIDKRGEIQRALNEYVFCASKPRLYI